MGHEAAHVLYMRLSRARLLKVCKILVIVQGLSNLHVGTVSILDLSTESMLVRGYHTSNKTNQALKGINATYTYQYSKMNVKI